MIQNTHIIKVTTLPATNTLPARVKMRSELYSQTVVIPFSNEPGSAAPTLETAINYLSKINIQIIAKGSSNDCYYLISDTFKEIK